MNKKSGKGKGKHFEDLAAQKGKTNPEDDGSFNPGALKKNTHVLARIRASNDFKLAKILEVRRLEDNKDEEFTRYDTSEAESKMMLMSLEGEASLKYRYYVNYQGL